MNWHTDGSTLTLCLEGRLDALASEQVQAEINQCIAEHPGLSLCLDMDKLDYISSSGIRILISLQKKQAEKLLIRNAAPGVYEVLDITGVTSLMDVRRKPRPVSVDGCEVIGRGAFGTVYRLDGDTVVKVFQGGESSLPGIEKELTNAKQAFLSGIPTAIPFDVVRVGEHYGMAFELIDARNCNDLVIEDPGVLDKLIPTFAAFLKNLHSLEARSQNLRVVRNNYLGYMETIGPRLDPAVAERILELLKQLPDTPHMIHGDIQLKNVMISRGEMILIDMDHLALGDPVFEFAGLFAPYIAFNEDDPEDSLRFLGVDGKTCERIFTETLDAYLGDADEAARRDALLKIRVAGYLRFLKILLVELAGKGTPLYDLQIRHAAEHLAELVPRVTTLTL